MASEREERYWSNLEKLYVHNVYEKISHRYDEFIKLSAQLSYYDSSSHATAASQFDNPAENDEPELGHNQETNRDLLVKTTATTAIDNRKDVFDVLKNKGEIIDDNNNHHVMTSSSFDRVTLNSSPSHPTTITTTTTTTTTTTATTTLSKLNSLSMAAKLKQTKHSRNGSGGQCNNGKNVRGHSKHSPWPKVKKFLLQLDRYSVIADVGCGDGKYLNVNSQILSVGSDRSISLCKLAAHKSPPVEQSVTNRNQIVICDNLAMPFRSDYFDAVISIGVIHHLSTEKRRIRALQELERILKPGGKIMIYVWALEQKLRKFNSQDVLVPMIDAAVGSNMYRCSGGDVKYRLRRDLSNNSTAESEDSNNEESSALVSSAMMENQNLKLNNNYNNNHNNQNNNNTQNQAHQIINDDDDDTNLDTKSPNFVENLKRFFVRKFQIGGNSSSPPPPPTPPPPPQAPSTTTLESKPTDDKQTTTNGGSVDPIERYRQIINEHKDKLPENFTIRRFPSSSCPDTFEDEPLEIQPPPQQLTNQPPPPSSVNIMNVTVDSSSSASLTPSPINHYAPPSVVATHAGEFSSAQQQQQQQLLNDDIDDNAFLNSSTKSEPGVSPTHLSSDSGGGGGGSDRSPSAEHGDHSLVLSRSMVAPTTTTTTTTSCSGERVEPTAVMPFFTSDLNHTNKRFYHVFRQGELDRLVQDYCRSLRIYESYHDHGNWCICAIKD